jgi:hypothetical protein
VFFNCADQFFGFSFKGALLARVRVRACLASLACCAAVFLGVGGAIWSQLVIGWQWSAPDTAATTVATFVMTGTVLVLGLVALLAVLPVAWTVASRLARGQARALAVPSALFLAGLAVMIVGSRHFGNGWPGTGGHPWARTGLVPGGVAAFAWASTLSVSSFWAHPAALAAFPAAELTWMVLSPLALACLAASLLAGSAHLSLGQALGALGGGGDEAVDVVAHARPSCQGRGRWSVRCTTPTRSAVDQPNISMPAAASSAPIMRWSGGSARSLAPKVVKLASEK